MRSTSRPLGWRDNKKETTTSVVEVEEHAEPSLTAGVNKVGKPLWKTAWRFL